MTKHTDTTKGDSQRKAHKWASDGFCIYCHNVHKTDNNARSTCSDGYGCKGQETPEVTDEWKVATWPDGHTCEKHYVNGQYIGEFRNVGERITYREKLLAKKFGSESGAETVRKLLDQRDELLTALKLVYSDTTARFGMDKITNTPISEIVRAAIAKAEGK